MKKHAIKKYDSTKTATTHTVNQPPCETATKIDIHLRSQDIEDAAIQAALQPWVVMECYQLSPGNQLSKMDILDLGNQQIVRETQSAAVQKLGVTPKDFCTFSYCTLDPNFRFSELTARTADTLFFIPEHTEYDIYVPTGVQTSYVSLSQEVFIKGAQILNPVQWENAPQQLITLQSTQQAALKAAMNQWIKMAETIASQQMAVDTDIISNHLLQQILHIATETSPESRQPSFAERLRAFHTCRMARAFVEECLACDIVPTIVDICASVGVSERTLQYAFRAYVNMSPMIYLRFCRLNRVRAALRASDPRTTTVTNVAMQFGFLHLGRFALDYKQVFGESPSTTLSS